MNKIAVMQMRNLRKRQCGAGVVQKIAVIGQQDGGLDIVQRARNAVFDLAIRYKVAAFGQSLRNSRLVQAGSAEMYEDQNGLITQGFGARQKVDFRRMRKHSFKTERPAFG